MEIIEKRAYQKQWRENNQEYIKNYAKEYNKKYYLKNKERLKKVRKEWELKNPDKRANIRKTYLTKNKLRLSQKGKFFRQQFPDLSRQYTLKYRKSTLGKYQTLYSGAKRRDFNFDISLKDFEKLIQLPCNYCGEIDVYIGLDRVNNEIGYEIDNVCPCCTVCNMMKKTLSKEDFINHCKKIAKFNN
jgi:hypothetical protein